MFLLCAPIIVAIVCTDNCCYCAPVIVGVVCTDYQLLLLFKNNGCCCAPIIVVVCTPIYCYWLAVYAPNIVVIVQRLIVIVVHRLGVVDNCYKYNMPRWMGGE